MQFGRWSEESGINIEDVTQLKTVGDKLVVQVRDYVGDLVNKTLRVTAVVVSDCFFYKMISFSRLLKEINQTIDRKIVIGALHHN